MGLYDYVKDEQVKCFYSVYWSESLYGLDCDFGGPICRTDGQMKTYNEGDSVPYNHFFYNYTKNFNICISDYNFFVAVREGKIAYTKDLNSCNDSDFEGNVKCIDYFGDTLKIRDAATLLQYIEDSRRCEETRISGLQNMIRIQSELKNKHLPAEERNKLENEYNFLDSYYKDKCNLLNEKYYDKSEDANRDIGQILYCFLNFIPETNPTDSLVHLKEFARQRLEYYGDTKEVIDNYLEWLGDEDLVKCAKDAIKEIYSEEEEEPKL